MAGLLRFGAVVASVFVLIGFLAFVSDEASSGSKHQIQRVDTEITDPAPTAGTEREREHMHGPVREFIDDANDVLLAPFDDLVGSHNVWVRRLVPTFLALLLYGFGLALLANFLPSRAPRSKDWRTAG